MGPTLDPPLHRFSSFLGPSFGADLLMSHCLSERSASTAARAPALFRSHIKGTPTESESRIVIQRSSSADSDSVPLGSSSGDSASRSSSIPIQGVQDNVRFQAQSKPVNPTTPNLAKLLLSLNHEVPSCESHLCQLATELGIVSTRNRQYRTCPAINPDSLIGTGGFAIVQKAVAEDNEHVAAKVMKQALPFKDFIAEAEYWSAEILITSQADHPNVMHCYGWDIEQSLSEPEEGELRVCLFRMRIFMPLMFGSLECLTKAQDLQPNRLFRLFAQAAAGLDFIHQQLGVVHNDVKGANILLDAHDNAVVADFGLSSLMAPGVSMVPEPKGHTRGYVAPERMGKAGNVVPFSCPASDVWALAVEMARLYRRIPALYRPEGNAAQAPLTVQQLLAACLASDPDARMSACEMQQVLMASAEGQVTTAQVLVSSVYKRACAGAAEPIQLPVAINALSVLSGGSVAVSTIVFSSDVSSDSNNSSSGTSTFSNV